MREIFVQHIFGDYDVSMRVPNGNVICIAGYFSFINNAIIESVHIEEKKMGLGPICGTPAQDLYVLENLPFTLTENLLSLKSR
ncbi:hypothetical protein TNCT_578651 [Trichonephila clavata]|uniref:Uncharacterized protein n=1 Tax=Trichonephila clavata TaxID=2740835 RepID=A0A8X6HWI7_TRICU|nr:hypothetical protein TNCT_578651 [Trichonephila clavata]